MTKPQATRIRRAQWRNKAYRALRWPLVALVVFGSSFAVYSWQNPKPVASLTPSQEQLLEPVEIIYDDTTTYIIPEADLAAIDSVTRIRLREDALVTVEKLLKVGNSFSAHGHDSSALKYYRTAMTQSTLTGLGVIELGVMVNMATAHCRLDHFDSCFYYRQRALSNPDVDDYPRIKAGLHNGIGTILLDRGHGDTAMSHFKDARLIYVDLNDTVGVLDVDANIANIHFYEERYPIALAMYEAVQRHYFHPTTASDSTRLASALFSIGNVHVQERRTPIAYRYYQEARLIYETLDDSDGITDIWSTLGMFFARVNETDSAVFFLNNALQKNIEGGDKIGRANCHGNLGNLYLNMGDSALARKHFQQSLQAHSSVPYRPGIALASAQLGFYYKDRKESDSAICYLLLADSVMVTYNLPRHHTQVIRALGELGVRSDTP